MGAFADSARLGRVLALVVASTLALTASFVGLVGLADGAVHHTTTRLPIYVTATAAVFVGAVVVFEGSSGGWRALGAAAAAAVATLFVVGFGGEGVVYALAEPGDVFDLQLLGYLLSAALMGTGVGYWAWRNLGSLRTGGLGDAL